MQDFTAIVLAAGKGVRMKSSTPKVLQLLRGKPIINHVLEELSSLPCMKQIIVVVGHQAPQVQKHIKSIFKHIEFVRQKKLLGTADAVLSAKDKARYSNVLILCADTALVTKATLSSFLQKYLSGRVSCALITAMVDFRNELGKIVRDKDGNVKAIREKIDLDSDPVSRLAQSATKEINSGIYAFDCDVLFENLLKIQPNQNKGEYFLTDIIEIMYNDGNRIGSYILEESEEVLGINSQKDLAMAERILNQRVLSRLMDAGVRIMDPQSTVIAEGVKIGKNTLIFPFTFIERNVIIGSHCTVGPFIHLREGTRVADNTDVGNFVEICRSKIGKYTKIKHFSYIGDATVADEVNIGAGTVVANFDGKNKNKTVIGKGAFVGSDTVLVAPVKIGKKALTGAGSVVTRNVGPSTVVVGVPAHPVRRAKKR